MRDGLVAEGWTVTSPCVCQGPCPALSAGPSHTCHDEVGWNIPGSVLRTAEALGLDRKLIKMTWFVASPLVAGSVAENRYRVVSEPMLNKAGRVRFLLCGESGRVPFSAKRDDEVARSGGFFSLRRYDLIDLHNPEKREGGLGFGPRTVIWKK